MSLSLGFVYRLCWGSYLGLLIRYMLSMLSLDLTRWLYVIPLIMAGWYALVSRCVSRLACMSTIPLPVEYASVPRCTLSLSFIWAPPPYRMVNAGLCLYIKNIPPKKSTFEPLACQSLSQSFPMARSESSVQWLRVTIWGSCIHRLKSPFSEGPNLRIALVRPFCFYLKRTPI